VFEVATEFCPATGVRLDEDCHPVRNRKFVERRRCVLQSAFDACARVRSEMDVDVPHPQGVGNVDLPLHRRDRLLPEVGFWRREIHEVGGVDDPRADIARLGGLTELRGVVGFDVRVLPHLR